MTISAEELKALGQEHYPNVYGFCAVCSDATPERVDGGIAIKHPCAVVRLIEDYRTLRKELAEWKTAARKLAGHEEPKP